MHCLLISRHVKDVQGAGGAVLARVGENCRVNDELEGFTSCHTIVQIRSIPFYAFFKAESGRHILTAKESRD